MISRRRWIALKIIKGLMVVIVGVVIIMLCNFCRSCDEANAKYHNERREVARKEGRLIGDYWVIKIDEYEYLQCGSQLTHKGNCKHCKEK